MKSIKSTVVMGILSLSLFIPSIGLAQSNSLDDKVKAMESLVKQQKSEMSSDESSVMDNIREKFPNATILGSVEKANDELYQVWFGGQLAYTNKNVDYMLTGGSLIDVNKMADLTEPAYSERSADAFEKLPLELAIKKVYGDGERKLVVFIDPDCPYCQQFEQMLERNKGNLNLTTYAFMMPLTQIHPDAYDKAVKIMCSTDSSQALSDLYLQDKQPTGQVCEQGKKIVDYHQALAESFGFNSTPTLLFENNEAYPGSLGYLDLDRILDYVYK